MSKYTNPSLKAGVTKCNLIKDFSPFTFIEYFYSNLMLNHSNCKFFYSNRWNNYLDLKIKIAVRMLNSPVTTNDNPKPSIGTR